MYCRPLRENPLKNIYIYLYMHSTKTGLSRPYLLLYRPLQVLVHVRQNDSSTVAARPISRIQNPSRLARCCTKKTEETLKLYEDDKGVLWIAQPCKTFPAIIGGTSICRHLHHPIASCSTKVSLESAGQPSPLHRHMCQKGANKNIPL